MANTTKGFPYPQGADAVDVAGDIQALAEAVDDMPGVQSYTGTEISNLTAGEKWAGRIVWNSTTSKLQVSNGSTFSDVDTSLALSSTTPEALGVAAAGTSGDASRADHVHAMPSASSVGAIANSTVDAAGDLIVASADNTVGRLPLGSNGQVLAVDTSGSGVNKVKWTTPATPGPIVSHYFTTGQGSVTVTVPTGRYWVETDATDTVVTVGAASVTGKGPNLLNVTTTGSSFGVSRPAIPATPDPTTWTSRTSGFGASSINSLAYGGTLYLAGGASGTLTTSTDAITWTTRTSGFGATAIRAVSYGASTYVAGGDAAQIRSSTDGITWTTRTSNVTDDIYGLTFGGGLFAVSTTSGKIATSTDGITWTSRTSNSGGSALYTIAYGAGVFVAAGAAGVIRSSTDGITWTTRTAAHSVAMYGSTFGTIFLLGGAGLQTSTDGITWTSRTTPFGADQIRALAYESGIYVASGQNGKVSTSTDGITWTTRTANLSTTFLFAAASGDGLFLVGGGSGALSTSARIAAANQPTAVFITQLTTI